MHFRVRGHAIQLVRTAYDPEKKGAKSVLVGKMPRRTREIPEELKAKLTADEAAEFATYLEQTRVVDEMQRKVTAHTLGETVAQAVDYFKDITEEAERDRLHAIFAEAIVVLRRATQGKASRETKRTKRQRDAGAGAEAD